MTLSILRVYGVHLFQSTPRVQAGWPIQVFLNRCTDDQEEENESGLFLLLVCSCTHALQSGVFWIFTSSQKKSMLSGFFPRAALEKVV